MKLSLAITIFVNHRLHSEKSAVENWFFFNIELFTVTFIVLLARFLPETLISTFKVWMKFPQNWTDRQTHMAKSTQLVVLSRLKYLHEKKTTGTDAQKHLKCVQGRSSGVPTTSCQRGSGLSDSFYQVWRIFFVLRLKILLKGQLIQLSEVAKTEELKAKLKSVYMWVLFLVLEATLTRTKRKLVNN